LIGEKRLNKLLVSDIVADFAERGLRELTR
jgi:hypothetical protein